MPDSSPGTHESASEGSWSAGLRSKAWVIASAFVALGFVLRLRRLTWWINPDEGIYCSIVQQPTFAQSWRELTSNAHPPLFSIVLWLMSAISPDPTWLRMMSLVSGCAAIVGMWLLGRELVGVTGGLVVALLAAVSPAAIELSQVIRPYMLQLAFVSFGLYGIARWLRERRGLLVFSVCMSLAVLTHYSSFLVVGVVMILLAIQGVRGQFERKELVSLALALLPVVVIMAVLYFGHVRPNMVGSDMQKTAKEGWLRPFFLRDAQGAWINLLGTLRYLVGTSLAAPAVIVLFAGIVLGILKESQAAVLSVTMLVLAVLASAAGQYPFGGTRHSMYLLVCVAVSMGLAVELLLSFGSKPAIASAVVLLGIVIARAPLNTAIGANVAQLLLSELVTPPDQMKTVEPLLKHVRETDGVVIMNQQTYYCLQPVLGSYMAAPVSQDKLFYEFRWEKRDALVAGNWEMTLEGKRINEDAHLYTFLHAVARNRPELRLLERKTIWLLFAGWTMPLVRQLQAAARLPEHKGLLINGMGIPGFAAIELDMPRFRGLYERRR